MYHELVEALRLCVRYGKAEDALANAKQAADAIEELYHENESLANSVNEASELLRKRWIPVTERLPDHNGWYLAYGPTIKVEILHFYSASKVWVSQMYDNFKVTHWTMLPEPPKEEDHGNLHRHGDADKRRNFLED